MEEDKGEEGETSSFKEEKAEMSRLDKMEKRSVIITLLREVRRELGLAQNSVAEIVDVLISEKSDKEVEVILNTKITAKGMIRKDLDRDGLMLGEWINVALSKLNTATDKKNLTGVNTLLKMVLYKIILYDIAYPMPTRMSGGAGGEVVEETQEVRGLEKTVQESTADDAPKHEGKTADDCKVKSYVNKKGMREWKCPVGCGQDFRSSRMCGAHLNEHLGRVYECPTCKYKTYNLDSYEKHKCFSGSKTHGEKRKPSATKRKSGRSAEGESGKRKKVVSAASGAPKGTVGEGKDSGTGKESGVVVKVEKEESDDEEIIVIE